MPEGHYDRSTMKKPIKKLDLVETVAAVPTDAEFRTAELMTIVKETHAMVKKLFDALHGEVPTKSPRKKRGATLAQLINQIMADGAVHSVYEVWQTLGADKFNEKSLNSIMAQMAREEVLKRVRAGLYTLSTH